MKNFGIERSTESILLAYERAKGISEMGAHGWLLNWQACVGFGDEIEAQYHVPQQSDRTSDKILSECTYV